MVQVKPLGVLCPNLVLGVLSLKSQNFRVLKSQKGSPLWGPPCSPGFFQVSGSIALRAEYEKLAAEKAARWGQRLSNW